jgi:hypothetical protein
MTYIWHFNMSSITQFPFPSGTALESQVVEWLAEVLYPLAYRPVEEWVRRCVRANGTPA